VCVIRVDPTAPMVHPLRNAMTSTGIVSRPMKFTPAKTAKHFALAPSGLKLAGRGSRRHDGISRKRYRHLQDRRPPAWQWRG